MEIDTGTTFLCDSKGRLWIGADRGEWGGALQVVDLRARPLAVRKVSYEKSELNGIYGLVESPKGDILAFGGTLHMGFGSAQLTKFSPSGSSQEIYAAKFNGWTTQPVTPNPTLPITQALSKEGRWLVFSYDAAFECDGAFRNWKRIATLHVRTNPGRPDAVASYPGIVRVDDVGGRILLTTHLDGLLELRRGEIVRHTLPDQLDVAPDTVILWRDGLAARDREGDLAVRLDGQERAVRCQVRSISGFSAHADESELIDWLANFGRGKKRGDAGYPRRVFLVHGDPDAQAALEPKVKALGFDTVVPHWHQRVTLD